MTVLDVVLLALLGLSAWGGYRRGAVLQVAGLAGLGAGFVIGVWLAPHVAGFVRSDLAEAAVALGTIVVLGALGDAVASFFGLKLRRRTRGTRFRAVDAVGGSALSAVALVLTIWFLGINLAAGPFPSVAEALQRSTVVRVVDAALPAPPALGTQVDNVLELIGFPDVFSGLPPLPAEPVAPPAEGVAGRAARDARGSIVLITGPACDRILQGTGFVVADDLVLTNAHVVAGGSPRVEWNDLTFDAMPVLVDRDLDAAILRVDGLDAPALRLLPREVPRGAGGAVVGFPHGRYAELPAAVRRALDAVGRDIDGDDEVRRRIYEVQATVQAGNSGGPFALPGGRAAGMVFGASVADGDVSYALTSPRLIPLVERAVGAGPVGTGPCVA
ncbi:MAG TPA: MarP family serine protease [Actinomycetota bacterium]|nr:MarP family serine protease [Actinomycetota bacterium]